MALRNVTSSSRPLLHPKTFVKPPFYTYANHFFARVPASAVARNLFWLDATGKKQVYLQLRLALARTLNLAIFAGCVILVFHMVRPAYGTGPARVAALLLATSAGFVPYQVFLTTDLAVVFMMLAAFACAVRIVSHPGMAISMAGGLLAGLATATKYNGLIVAAALPVAHLLASRGNPVMACLKRPAAWVCGLCVPAGFLLGNPYALLDWPTFASEFLYNWKVTPVYNGATEGTGYPAFFYAFVEILGWPGTWILVAGVVAGGWYLATERGRSAWHLWLLAAVVFAVYAWKIGGFPRVETRFVLPSVPFALLLGAAGFGPILRWRAIAIPVLAAVLIYNVVCSWLVGQLFREDPRMAALEFAARELATGDTVELSESIPRLQELPDRKLRLIKIPAGIERNSNFLRIFASDEQMQDALKRRATREGPEWFTPAARSNRNPDWIFWSSIDVEGIVRHEYEALSRPGSGYRVVFDASSPSQPRWIYPRATEFLRNRTTIWQKSPCP